MFRVLPRCPPPGILFRAPSVSCVDQSGLYAVEDLVNSMCAQGKKILMVELKKQPRYMMERIDIIPDLVNEEHIFDSFNECLIWIKANVEDTYPKVT